MPDLSFRVEGAEAVPFSVSPTIALKLHVENRKPDEVIHTVVLRTQIMIDATKRHYTSEEQEQVRDLFGEPGRWSQTLRPLLWTHTSQVIPSFTASTVTDLPIPCTFDFNVAATKYFNGMADGFIPLNLQFSGNVFYDAGNHQLQIAPIPWSKETRYKLPVRIWREMMNSYYPNSAWLCLRRDVFERVHRFKVQRGIQTLEETLVALLSAAEPGEVPG